jgi:hypothetical protein
MENSVRKPSAFNEWKKKNRVRISYNYRVFMWCALLPTGNMLFRETLEGVCHAAADKLNVPRHVFKEKR